RQHCRFGEPIVDGYFCAAFHFAHLALVAFLIFARPAAEMFRLGLMETSVWPRVRAQRAFCEAEILARAAAPILRGPCNRGALFIPLSALIAVSRAFTCCATLSLSAFNSAIMSVCSSPGEDCSKYSRNYACGSLHQRKQHPQSFVKLIAFLRSAELTCLQLRPTIP